MLVYDIGMHNGDDTAHYLSKGHHVVAVEANPVLCADAEERFAGALAAGRLTLLNVAIADVAGEVALHVCREKSDWSSVNDWVLERDATFDPVTVPAVTFESVIAEHGVPWFCKIDIEGNDMLCAEAVAGRAPFLSVELGRRTGIAELAATGYRRFKVIDQRRFRPPRSLLPAKRFPPGSSGPMPHESPGRWLTAERAERLVGWVRAHWPPGAWYDLQATH